MEKESSKLVLISKDTDLSTYNKSKMKRSQQAKKDYHISHKTQKTKGYELDHIIPLLEAENVEEFKYLDNWLNLLYIDGQTYAIKSQNNSRYYILSFDDKDLDTVYFSDVQSERLVIKNGEQALFDNSKVQDIFAYNQAFLNHTNVK